ncbi:hypothetical protein VTO42DRAFT_7032 [Malbranchea cinnamomea]
MSPDTRRPGDPEKSSVPGPAESPPDRSPSTSSLDQESTTKESPLETHDLDADVDLEDARSRAHSVCRVETAPVGPAPGEGILSRTLSLVRTRDSGRDPGPPPDGGFHAWLQAGLAHLVIFNTWGYINSFGVFQSYYTESLNRPPSDISWIGSIQIFLLFFIGTFSGRATDAGFFKVVWSIGAVIVMLGVFMASLSTKYWQLFLCQGLCLGVGSGFMFCPTIALTATYFARRRALALAIGATGSATGGIVFPVVVQRLLPRIGFPWTMRVLGLITAVTFAPGFVFLRPRIPPRKSGPFFEFAAFKEPHYTLYAIGMYLDFWALYVAFFYVGAYGREVIGVSQETSITLVMVMNSVGTVGRIIPGIISDWKCGPFNVLIPYTFATGVMFFAWIGIKSLNTLYAFSVLYGLFGAGIQSLFPAASTSLTTDLKKTGVRFGMIMSIVSFASLTGSPIAGALIQRGNGDYLYAQLFGALSMVVGGCILCVARYKFAGPKFWVRV